MASLSPLDSRGRKRRALLSVTDKTGLADLARLLRERDWELIASGGTAAHLRERGLPVTGVEQLTGFPEILGGRVKTLHPLIAGGILGRREEDFAPLQDLQVHPIDLVVVNLYRFEETVAGGADFAAALEKIDVGGPTLLRAAAKNHDRVTVLSDPAHYAEFAAELAQAEVPGPEFRRRMAAAAFARTAAYDRAIADWMRTALGATAAETLALRYGENPHQGARLEILGGGGLAACGLLQHGGKELSYNNLVDLVAALKLAFDFEEPCCAVIKHTNPCGFARGEPAAALERALLCDPVSAFGGVFAFNAPIDEAAARVLHARFLEIVAAPAYAPEALALLGKKKNVRVLSCDRGAFLAATRGPARAFGRLVLHQDEDEGFPELAAPRLAAGARPEGELAAALEMAWRVCKHVKSNAIVLADARGTLGVGAGQMSRVDSARLAVGKAREQGFELKGAVAASDGFFPFPDGIELLAAAGIGAIVAPGGSVRDDEVAAAAAHLGVTLLLTDRRHFRH